MHGSEGVSKQISLPLMMAKVFGYSFLHECGRVLTVDWTPLGGDTKNKFKY